MGFTTINIEEKEMKTKDEIQAKIEEFSKDERYKSKPALVQINAPLALIQVEIQSKIDALMWVLDWHN